MTPAPRGVADPAAPTDSAAAGSPLRPLWWAAGALVVAVALALTFPQWRFRVPYGWAVAANYLLTWGPLVVALVATFGFWRALRGFKPADLYLGVVIGVVARAIGVIVELLTTGRMPGGGLMLGDVTALYVFSSVIAPVVLAPLVEEPFFRGLLQGSLARLVPPWTSLLLTSLVFAVVHTIADGWSVSLVVTLFAFALLAGYATRRTGRLGPAIIGHAAFNGLAALIAWPW